jgi:YfiH family protein
MLKFLAENLAGQEGIEHAFFGRVGGVSSGLYASLNCGPGSNDDRRLVIENRERARAALSPSANRLLTLYQIHGRDVAIVDEPWEIGGAPRADAMACATPGLALGILTADCAPVLLADAEARVVGAAHAGWKGALAGVIESAIRGMEELGARRARIAAAIGPCISQPAYEVGADFRARVVADDPGNERFFVSSTRPDHWRFDLRAYARSRLEGAGVGNVCSLDACTYAQDLELYSFRRATHRGEGDYGRQLSAIMLV